MVGVGRSGDVELEIEAVQQLEKTTIEGSNGTIQLPAALEPFLTDVSGLQDADGFGTGGGGISRESMNEPPASRPQDNESVKVPPLAVDWSAVPV